MRLKSSKDDKVGWKHDAANLYGSRMSYHADLNEGRKLGDEMSFLNDHLWVLPVANRTGG